MELIAGKKYHGNKAWTGDFTFTVLRVNKSSYSIITDRGERKTLWKRGNILIIKEFKTDNYIKILSEEEFRIGVLAKEICKHERSIEYIGEYITNIKDDIERHKRFISSYETKLHEQLELEESEVKVLEEKRREVEKLRKVQTINRNRETKERE
ncbi:MAG: hypothetical protein ACRDDY_04315 [Clostridium sp.]|uniref:hypothetical protein n=1 Tax=Clostridium sp. TaxID=1506 RepID=UPI003EE74B4A